MAAPVVFRAHLGYVLRPCWEATEETKEGRAELDSEEHEKGTQVEKETHLAFEVLEEPHGSWIYRRFTRLVVCTQPPAKLRHR